MFVHARTVLRVGLQLAVLVAIVAAFFLRLPQVTGPSMLPHITPGEIVLINTLAYRFGPIQRGDVVALHRDDPESRTYLKRIVGLPGDRVRIDAGVLFVNGRAVDEPYVAFHDRTSVAEQPLPADDYFALGDNRAESEDSRTWGPIARGAIVGKAVVGLWPLGTVIQ